MAPPRKPPEKLHGNSKYRPELCEVARRHYAGGATDLEVADALKIHVATLYRWHADHPEFCEAAKAGKDPADDRVERAFYHRAVGYTFEAEKLFQYEGQVIRAPYREHVPPDTKAAIQWLQNRRPEKWREGLHLTGGLTVLTALPETALDQLGTTLALPSGRSTPEGSDGQ